VRISLTTSESETHAGIDVARIQAHLQAIHENASGLPSVTPAPMERVSIEPVSIELAPVTCKAIASGESVELLASKEYPSPAEHQPQFSMLSLMAVMTLISVFCAAIPFLGPWWSAMLLWFSVLATAHVSANVWGSQFSRHSGDQRALPDAEALRESRAASAAACAPSTALRHNVQLGRKLHYVVAAAATVGSTVGLISMLAFGLEKVGIPGLVLATCSLGFISGLVGFLVGSFIQVASNAMREAARPPRT
jgi:hypothetical protein